LVLAVDEMYNLIYKVNAFYILQVSHAPKHADTMHVMKRTAGDETHQHLCRAYCGSTAGVAASAAAAASTAGM
jgi:hypothetical protein